MSASAQIRDRFPAMTGAGSEHFKGHVTPGFEPVREAFAKNFSERGELGGACCVCRHGETVVDLWGGIRDEATGAPWRADTMVLVFSATKGLAAMTLALARSRGWLDYDEKIAAYWPEFACNGKEATTVRQLLAHQAGLAAFGEKVDREVVADPDRLGQVMARQKPAWPPGDRVAYHALSLGFYEGELIRRVDPQHRTIGQVFRDEIATPLGLDAHIRLPEEVPDDRLAPVKKANMWKMLWGFPLPLLIASINPRSLLFRALVVNPGAWLPVDESRVYARDLEVPSGGGIVSARGLAGAYSAFAAAGGKLGLTSGTLVELMAPPLPSKHGFYDECMKGEIAYALGFMRPCANWPFGRHASAFGAPGAGGSMGFADPEDGIAYAYVTNRMGETVTGDPRDVALRDALTGCLGAAG
jgi:CubicO group peptidase (beta-lactamase class C family)